ncbi:hypothetical protein [Aureicoccus marinus]|jgi:hypothetical protein|uniref:hypothetical protein n=1 Tax=Aureicoccus marinus TaxID=754435 RepID=UPI0015E28875|nr:hypothetical protein [Aureicoccus marinus]
MKQEIVKDLRRSEQKEIKGGILPVLLVMTLDAILLGTMGGYIYESFTSDH